jgi:hypothetical protein
VIFIHKHVYHKSLLFNDKYMRIIKEISLYFLITNT